MGLVGAFLVCLVQALRCRPDTGSEPHKDSSMEGPPEHRGIGAPSLLCLV